MYSVLSALYCCTLYTGRPVPVHLFGPSQRACSGQLVPTLLALNYETTTVKF